MSDLLGEACLQTRYRDSGSLISLDIGMLKFYTAETLCKSLHSLASSSARIGTAPPQTVQKGNMAQAREAYEKALGLELPSRTAPNNPAWPCAAHGGDTPKALTLYVYREGALAGRHADLDSRYTYRRAPISER